jgi:UDP-3-O-[3-hydroxymyristoyl] glucosamine N-acyltransferase
MKMSLAELARLVGGELQGDGGIVIEDAVTMRDAGPGHITIVDSSLYAKRFLGREVSAAVTLAGLLPPESPAILVDDCHAAFARLVMLFRPLPSSTTQQGVSPSAHVHSTARLGEGVTVYPHAHIDADVEIGSHTIIHSGVSILAGARIGANCVLYPNTVLYEGTRVGNRVTIHANATIGAYGFGYHTVGGRHQLSAQLGYVELQDDVEIGAGSTIDRGTYDPTVIGEGTKIDNQVMVAHNCRIGKHNLLCSQVGIAGSCTTGDYVVMAGQVGIRDHVHIGTGARIGAKAGVHGEIPAGEKYLGVPATPEKEQRTILMSLAKLPQLRKQVRVLQHELERLLGRPVSSKRPDAA